MRFWVLPPRGSGGCKGLEVGVVGQSDERGLGASAASMIAEGRIAGVTLDTAGSKEW